MQKFRPNLYILALCGFVLATIFGVSCSHDNTGNRTVAGAYTITGSFFPQVLSCSSDSDSVTVRKDSASVKTLESVLDSLGFIRVYVDNHDSLYSDSIKIENGTYTFQHMTDGVDKIYFFYPEGGASLEFYATAGMDLRITADSLNKPIFSDSINGWVRTQYEALRNVASQKLYALVDSICKENRNSIRATLLLKSIAGPMNDSLMVRRCLGNIATEFKPQWLVDEIDDVSAAKRKKLVKNVHLTANEEFVGAACDTFKIRNFEGQLLYIVFWADFNKKSVEQMHGIADWSKKNSKKEIAYMSFCLHAEDSASWKKEIEKVPGKHVLLKAGFNTPLVQRWGLSDLPTTLILNRVLSVKQLNASDEDVKREFDLIQDKGADKKKTASKPASTKEKKGPALKMKF